MAGEGGDGDASALTPKRAWEGRVGRLAGTRKGRAWWDREAVSDETGVGICGCERRAVFVMGYQRTVLFALETRVVSDDPIIVGNQSLMQIGDQSLIQIGNRSLMQIGNHIH